jgi:hypothetical protein
MVNDPYNSTREWRVGQITCPQHRCSGRYPSDTGPDIGVEYQSVIPLFCIKALAGNENSEIRETNILDSRSRRHSEKRSDL